MSQAPLLVHQLMDYPRSRNGDDNDEERKRRLKLDFLLTFWRIIQEQGVSSTSSTLHTISNKDDKHRLENIIQDKILHCHPACALYYPRFDACI